MTTTQTTSLPTELPEKCTFLYTWHAGSPEAKKYWRTNAQHRTSSERFESGLTLTACEVCGHCAGDY